MKRQSLNTFVILAMVLGIGSAFTTYRQKKLLTTQYAVWGIMPGHVVNPYYQEVNFYELEYAISDILYENSLPISAFGYQHLYEFVDEYNGNGYVYCFLNTNYICLAYVYNNTLLPETESVIEVLDGDYYMF